MGNPEIFEEAQVRVLGQDHVYPMIAFGTLKKKSAFKLYAKAEGLDFQLANAVSEQISYYDEAMKKADEEEKESIDIYDFVDKAYEKYIDRSREYWGIISDKKKAPSAYLLYQGNIRREIGLIKCKSESTKKEYITCVIDGAIAENYKFLKNDILKVDVVLLIDKVFKRIGIEHFDVNTLLQLSEHDEKVWDLYANGFTMGMNQVEQDGSRKKCMRYKPHNISELSAFIAAIRPGFKSMYQRFENREDFSWGIPSLDNLIRTEELPVSFLFFQEQVMSVLNYAGFPMDVCYGIIKSIAKKHPEKVRPLKQQFIDGFREQLIADENLPYEVAQKNAEDVWTIVNDNCGYGFNCVSGSTKIIRGAKNEHRALTVGEMYRIKNDKEYAKRTNHADLYKKYNSKLGYGQALSLYDDHRLRPNKIVGIYEAGIRQTYKITTESGCYLICTDNHRFPTPNGKKRLDELNIGDLLYCKGEYKGKKINTSLTDGNFEPNTPKKGQQGFQRKEDGQYSIFTRAVERHRKNNDCCEMCGAKQEDTIRFELHHIDMNRKNNCEENYMWLCCSCHKKIHYKNGRKKRYENGIETYLSPIISIEKYAVEMTYDIEMDDPAHTFVSESGLITSNSAHAYSVALDSLYQAWQKANYPYEFYETLLQHYSDKGNKSKVAALKTEMKSAFGIVEGEYKFGNDNRHFSSDKENHVIYPALSSIKRVSQKTANILYKLGENKYDTFLDLLVDMKKNRINATNINILTKLDYFSEFGEIHQLIKQYQYFDELYGGVQLNKTKVEKLGLPEDIVLRNSLNHTAKTYMKVNMPNLLKEYFAVMPYHKTTIADKAYYQFVNLGYIDIVDKSAKGCVVVLDVNTLYTPRIKVYALANGNTLYVKVAKKLFRENPFDVGCVLKINNQKKKNRLRKLEDGTFQKIPDEFEWWITDYFILRKPD